MFLKWKSFVDVDAISYVSKMVEIRHIQKT
jgi:hypothetical protein